MRDARIPEPIVDVLGLHRAHAGTWATLTILYLHADQRGQCNPSERTIARRGGCDVRTVKRAIRDLEAWGIVVVDRSDGIANTYRLATRDVLVTGDTRVTGQNHSPGTSMARTGDTGVREPGTPVSPKQEELKQALNRPGPRAAEERGPGADPEDRRRSFFLEGYGDVYEHDRSWALEQPDARVLYLKTFGPREAT